MKIIISPAKKMNVREDELDWKDLPVMLDRTETLMRYIQGLTKEEARALWKCNEAIAELNYRRFAAMNLTSRLTPAILAYEGLQYQYMAPGVFQTSELEYIQEHLRILSGFYGILRPLDGIVPYRLEMQAPVRLGPWKNLYEFWGDAICKELMKGEQVLVNLASKEYSKGVEPWLDPGAQMVQVDFCCLLPDRKGVLKPKIKATEAKMARGEMVRYMAENKIQDPEALKKFDRLGYRWDRELSRPGHMVFIKR